MWMREWTVISGRRSSVDAGTIIVWSVEQFGCEDRSYGVTT